MLDPLILDSMADVVVGFTIDYDLPPIVAKRARDFTHALYQEAADQCSKYDEILGIKQEKPLRNTATT